MKIKKPSAKYLSIFLVFLVLLSSSCSRGAAPPPENDVWGNNSYEAILLCLNHDTPVDLTDCLQEDGALKLEEGSDTRIYRNSDYSQLEESADRGLHIRLPEHFRLTAQNTGKDVTLSVVLKDSRSKVVYVAHEKTQGVIDISR